jgi:hypothetical protein
MSDLLARSEYISDAKGMKTEGIRNQHKAIHISIQA